MTAESIKEVEELLAEIAALSETSNPMTPLIPLSPIPAPPPPSPRVKRRLLCSQGKRVDARSGKSVPTIICKMSSQAQRKKRHTSLNRKMPTTKRQKEDTKHVARETLNVPRNENSSSHTSQSATTTIPSPSEVTHEEPAVFTVDGIISISLDFFDRDVLPRIASPIIPQFPANSFAQHYFAHQLRIGFARRHFENSLRTRLLTVIPATAIEPQAFVANILDTIDFGIIQHT